jgi:tetratricopeptide (TPR) repeat protein
MALRRYLLLAISACALQTGCASQMARSPVVKDYVDRQEFDAALEQIEQIDQGTSRLLYLYEKGIVLHYAGRYGESSAALEEAEHLFDDLYTKSLSREVGAILTSDNVIQYRGERYEAALVHYYKLLNYLHLSDTEGALVECRKLNNRLRFFADSEDSVYVGDPFLQYLTGMVYMEAGELSDADVSLRAALYAYGAVGARYSIQPPATLRCDLARCASLLGDLDAAAGYADTTGACDPNGGKSGFGTLNVLLECGYAPFKVEQNIVFPIYKNEVNDGTDTDKFAVTLSSRYGEPVNESLELDYVLRVAMPELVPSPEPFAEAAVRVAEGGKTREEAALVVENIDALAFEAFEARRGAILLKTVTRALAKYLAKEGVDDKSEIAGVIVNLFNVVTESADIRSWATLPQTIRMARFVLPEGTYDLEIVLRGAAPEEESHVIEKIEITGGRSRFVNFRVN